MLDGGSAEDILEDTIDPVELSIIIPVYNARATLKECLGAVYDSLYINFECIVVDDCSTDDSIKIAASFPVKLVKLSGRPHGPAHARNVGARMAKGRQLFFLDSDITIDPETLTKFAGAFEVNPEYTGVFGSYDDAPKDGRFISQYKNLSHAYFHQKGREEASTFWSGCGAIRREKFLELGGFDENRYIQPSIEDIELGSRVIRSGGRILLRRDIKVKHLKRWTFLGLLKTDIVSRAIPWTKLVLEDKTIPNDLNLTTAQRASAVLAGMAGLLFIFHFNHLPVIFLLFAISLQLALTGLYEWRSRPTLTNFDLPAVLLICVIGLICGLFSYYSHLIVLFIPLLIIFAGSLLSGLAAKADRKLQSVHFGLIFTSMGLIGLVTWWSAPVLFKLPLVVLIAGILWLNREYYGYFMRARGIVFAISAFPMQILYYYYSVLSFGIGAGIYYWEKLTRFNTAKIDHLL